MSLISKAPVRAHILSYTEGRRMRREGMNLGGAFSSEIDQHQTQERESRICVCIFHDYLVDESSPSK